MKALLLSASAPDATTKAQTGTTNWILRLTQVLHKKHEVTLITTPPVNDPWFEKSGVKVIQHNPAPIQNGVVRLIKSLLYGIYPSIWLLHCPETSKFLKDLPPGRFDVCWILEDYGGIYLRDIPRHLPVAFHRSYVFSMQDTFWEKGASFIKRLQGWYRQSTAIAFDRWTTARADMVSAGTPESCEFLKKNYRHKNVECIPVKPSQRPTPTTEGNLKEPLGPEKRMLAVYLADMRFVRNADGALWFLEKVLPLMSESLRKSYHFRFLGRKPDPLPKLNDLPSGSSVEFTGFVDNLTKSLHEAQVAFIPVFGGNGVRIKTLTLLGTGLPTVSTPDALEGLEVSNEREVLEAMETFLGEEEDAEKAFAFSQHIAGRQ